VSPLAFTFATFLASVLAGVIGSLFGLGGGIVVIPVLTLLLGVDIRYAIGASIVSVIATSSGAAAAYVRDRLASLRLSMLLEVSTAAGAITGALVGGLVDGRWLFVIFGVVLAYAAVSMLRTAGDASPDPDAGPPDALADRLRLHGTYHDRPMNRDVRYRVRRSGAGLAISYVAGVVSGLLGIGGGVIKVPTMNLLMGVPLKVATATSNLMIGVTAAASAGVYFLRGDINPFVAAPVAAGVLVGATGGSRVLPRLRNRALRVGFVAVLGWVSVQMIYRGIRG